MTVIPHEPADRSVIIDLNDIWQPPPRYNLRELRQHLAESARDWLPALFPQARRSRDDKVLRCADLTGRPPRNEGSCVIYLEGRFAGWGFDFATAESAGPIDLIYYATGLVDRALFEEAARLARVEGLLPPSRPAGPRPDYSLEIRRILDGCRPLVGSLAETYLLSRGLSDPVSPDLRFHEDLADYETARGYPAMVAVIRDGTGQPTGGIHRTFLRDDGSGKAAPGKKMLGPVGGGHVRLAAIGEDGRLGIAEGIETALAAAKLFAIPTWAGLSADGVRRFQWPPGIRELTIFADAGEAGRQAATALAERATAAGIEHRIVTPLYGDDFAHDLSRGAGAAEYQQQTTQSDVFSSPDPSLDASPDLPQARLSLQTVQDIEAAARTLGFPPDMTLLGRLLGAIATVQPDPVSARQVLTVVKMTTRIPIAVLEKQLRDLRRQLGANQEVIRPRWAARLRIGENGTPERNEANVITALTNDAAFVGQEGGALAFDAFRLEVILARPTPWETEPVEVLRTWSSVDDVRCAEWLQRRDVNVAPAIVSRAVYAIAYQTRIHPVQSYLESLVWDGNPRLDTWATAALGATDTPLTRAIAARWMISAVARIFQPGCKADHMLILEGPQGIKKSTALKVLAGSAWFTDELAEIGCKDADQQMRGVWIIELAELDAISRAEISRIKAFLSRTVDRYRPPYERYVIEVPRQCVFAGSVNLDSYLRDETGNRRFWPLKCTRIDIDALARDRDQLWAEAVVRYRQKCIWWLEEPELCQAVDAEQEARYQGDAWDSRIDHWLTHERRLVNRGYGAFDDWRTEEVERETPISDVSVGEILEQALGVEPAKWTKGDQMRVGAYLKARKWTRFRSNKSGREWRYRRPDWLVVP